jgi:hypothetical protein
MSDNKIISPEFDLLASAANFIKSEFKKDESVWAQSPFEWVLTLPSASKGKLGKRLVYQWCAIKGLSIDSCPDSQADMMINGHRVEIKFSTLWEVNIYKFQQIRDQNYEYAVCLGISPFEALLGNQQKGFEAICYWAYGTAHRLGGARNSLVCSKPSIAAQLDFAVWRNARRSLQGIEKSQQQKIANCPRKFGQFVFLVMKLHECAVATIRGLADLMRWERPTE